MSVTTPHAAYTESGWIYAFAVLGTSVVKIGGTKQSLRLRQQQLEYYAMKRLALIASVDIADELTVIEREIHAILRDTPHRGEWYEMVIDAPQLQALVAQAEERIVKWRAVAQQRSRLRWP